MTNTMMSSPQLQGVCDSGFGVRLIGVHVSALDFPKKISEVFKPGNGWSEIIQCESSGFITLLALDMDFGVKYRMDQEIELLTYRREPHQFFVGLSALLKKHQVRWVASMALTESLGSLTLTLLYQAALSA